MIGQMFYILAVLPAPNTPIQKPPMTMKFGLLTELTRFCAYSAIPCSAVGYRGLPARHFVFYSGGVDMDMSESRWHLHSVFP